MLDLAARCKLMAERSAITWRPSAPTVQISAGSIGDHFDAYNSSNIIVSGGSIGDYFQATKGSVVTISGGSVGDSYTAQSGSIVNLSGGSVGFLFNAQAGSQVNISGGSIAQALRTNTGSQVTISGYDFRLDGQLISGLNSVGSTKALNLAYPSLLSGTLADGSPFLFTPLVQDQIADGTLTLRAAAPLPETPTVLHVPTDSSTSRHSGQPDTGARKRRNIAQRFHCGKSQQVANQRRTDRTACEGGCCR